MTDISKGNDGNQVLVFLPAFTLFLNFNSVEMINNGVLNKRTELKWFSVSIIFLAIYCGFLFGFRSLLHNLENGSETILKPEPGQIIAIGFLILIYHFSYVGLYSFSGLGKLPGAVAALLAIIINLALLYA